MSFLFRGASLAMKTEAKVATKGASTASHSVMTPGIKATKAAPKRDIYNGAPKGGYGEGIGRGLTGAAALTTAVGGVGLGVYATNQAFQRADKLAHLFGDGIAHLLAQMEDGLKDIGGGVANFASSDGTMMTLLVVGGVVVVFMGYNALT